MTYLKLSCLLSLPLLSLDCLPLPVLAQTVPSQSFRPSSTSASPSSSSLSLSEALEKADQNNPQLLAARGNLPISRAGIAIAGATPNPQIGFQYGFGSVYTAAGNPQQVQLTQTIELGGKRLARLGLAKAQYQLAIVQLDAQRLGVRDQVRRAYAELAAAEGYAQALEEQTKLVQKLLEIARKRFEAGAAPEADVLQAKLSRMQLEPQQKQAQNRIQTDRVQLNALLGQPSQQAIDVKDKSLFDLTVQKTELVPAPDADFPPVESLLARAYSRRLDLKTAQQQQEVARRQLNVTRAQRVPDLQLTAGYVFSTYTNAAQDGPPSLNGSQATGVFVGATVTIPLFYHQQGEAAQAQATIDQASKQVEAQRQQVTADVQTAYRSLVTAAENVRQYRSQLLPASREVTALAQESYQVGKTGLASAIVAEQADQQVRSGYLDAVTAYQNAYADLEKAVGEPLAF